jgi:hypothetical protein
MVLGLADKYKEQGISLMLAGVLNHLSGTYLTIIICLNLNISLRAPSKMPMDGLNY